MKTLIALLLSSCIFLATPSQAQVVNAKGVATVSYNKKITPAEKEAAYKAAQVASIERYFAENGEAEAENFDAIKGKVEANLDKFILSTTVLNEQDQPSLSKYSMAVRTEINVAKLRNALRAGSEVAKAPPNSKSAMVYVFVARETAAVKSFDARVVQREDVDLKASADYDVSESASERESVRGGRVAVSSSSKGKGRVNASSSLTTTTGGSSTQKTDEVTYRVLSMANHKTAVTSVFSQSGYNVADPDFVLSDADMRSVKQDYSRGDDLAPGTMRGIVQSLRKVNVPMVVLATFDLGAPAADPATGLQRVAVTVTGRVLDLQGALPREIASVPAVQYVALGSDNAMAGTKAMKDAALAATREIVSRLNVLGVH